MPVDELELVISPSPHYRLAKPPHDYDEDERRRYHQGYRLGLAGSGFESLHYAHLAGWDEGFQACRIHFKPKMN